MELIGLAFLIAAFMFSPSLMMTRLIRVPVALWIAMFHIIGSRAKVRRRGKTAQGYQKHKTTIITSDGVVIEIQWWEDIRRLARAIWSFLKSAVKRPAQPHKAATAATGGEPK